jgi:uncharacterized protein (DUF924 family)
MVDRDRLSEVHRYWFGELKSPADVPSEKMKMWFGAPVEVDDDIREKFAADLDAASRIEWDLGRLSRVEQVGLVVLFDQFPRHMYRATGQQFAYDQKALAIARQLLKDGPGPFFPVERTFVSLPFMHSENLLDQDYAVTFVANVLQAAPPEARDGPRIGFDFAYKHWMIIKKFGRFPHRNAPLGRESTPEEMEFLKNGRGF